MGIIYLSRYVPQTSSLSCTFQRNILCIALFEYYTNGDIMCRAILKKAVPCLNLWKQLFTIVGHISVIFSTGRARLILSSDAVDNPSLETKSVWIQWYAAKVPT